MVYREEIVEVGLLLADYIIGEHYRDAEIIGFDRVTNVRSCHVVKTAECKNNDCSRKVANGVCLSCFEWVGSGKSPCGEEDAELACLMLLKDFNQQSNDFWDIPVPVTQKHVDFIVPHCFLPRELLIQVTRALVDSKAWEEFGVHRMVKKVFSMQDSLNCIWQAINKKADKIPFEKRSNIVLLLDAINTAHFSFPNITRAFKQQYAEKLKALGFQEIWIVGQQTTQLCK